MALKHLMARARPPVSFGAASTGQHLLVPVGAHPERHVFFGLLAGLALTPVSSMRWQVTIALGWVTASDAVGRLMLAGHNHSYERFALLDGEGRRDADGLRQFVVGTGGPSSTR